MDYKQCDSHAVLMSSPVMLSWTTCKQYGRFKRKINSYCKCADIINYYISCPPKILATNMQITTEA